MNYVFANKKCKPAMLNDDNKLATNVEKNTGT